MFIKRTITICLVLNSCGAATRFRQPKDQDAAPESEFPSDCSRPTIEESLKCIPGLTATEITEYKEVETSTPVKLSIPKGYRVFELQFSQPTDHGNRNGEWFNQRLLLWHRDTANPMILQTSGYSIFTAARAELTQLFDGNQIQVEHRFFLKSRPASGDWSKLTIEQSANDFHRVSQAFHSIYKMKWVNTGASKGGMTSVYHRYFFPNDLDATVAYVAPSSHSDLDDRYNQFLITVGGDSMAECRQKVDEFQRNLLKRKAEVMPLVKGDFSMIGGKDLAYEYAVSETFFTFWQYKNPNDPKTGCASIPKPEAPAQEFANALDSINPVDEGYGDGALIEFNPYFYQAAVELGAATPRLANINDLVTHPAVDFGLLHVVPPGTKPTYNGELVAKVESWAKTNAATTMFIYGTYDSWYAAAFPQPTESADSYLFKSNGGNHGTKIKALSKEDAAQAKSILGRWLDVNLAESAAIRGPKWAHRGINEVSGTVELTTEEIQFQRRR